MRALRQSSWHSAAPPRPAMPPVPTCSARPGAAARVVDLAARARWRQCKLVPFRGRQNGRKTRLHRRLASSWSGLHRFGRRWAAAPRPFRRLAQWKLARKRQGGAQGGQGGAEALDLAHRRLRERDARAPAQWAPLSRVTPAAHAIGTHMWRLVRRGCSCSCFGSTRAVAAT